MMQKKNNRETSCMNYIKAFISGVIFPSVILPFVLLYASIKGDHNILSISSLHIVPLVWGLWNVLYFAFFKNALHASENIRLLITGAVLGFILAAYAVFWLDLPTVLGIPTQIHCLPLFAAPIVYALAWRFIVKPLNGLVGLKEEN